jgi:alpha-N-arabinofuranosidase
MEIDLDFRSFGLLKLLEHAVLDGPDLSATNNFKEPEKVKPRYLKASCNSAGQLKVVLPKLSWNMLRFSIEYN